MAPRRDRTWPVLAICGVAVVGLLVAVAVVLRGDDGYPDEWDERVAPFVAYVEEERGLPFEHPVTVEFLTEDEYAERSRVDEGALTDLDREMFDESASVLVALGLVPPGTDLLDTSNAMMESGTLAFYDPATETVTVRGTEMTTALEVTLVHELVHVAQDQAFDLETGLEEQSEGSYEAFHAMVEGDASRIDQAYLLTLSAEEQNEYWDESMGDWDDAQDGLAEVPGAYQAMFAAPYLLGQPLAELIAEDGGNDAVDEAFLDPPASTEHLFDPRSYFDGDAPQEVEAPEVPDGADRFDDASELGAITLFVMLSERIDVLTALDAADGWGGDMSVAYREDDRTCVRADLVGDTTEDTAEIHDALQMWADAGPSGVATVEMDGDLVALEACAPPADDGAAAPTGAAFYALGVVAARSQLTVLTAVDGGAGVRDAFAVGDCFVRNLPAEALAASSGMEEPTPEVLDEIQATMLACRAE